MDDRAVRQALERLIRAGADLRPAFRDIGEHLDRATRARFDAERAPDGTPWAQIADSTLRGAMLKGVRRGKGGGRKSVSTRGGSTKAGAVRALAAKRILVESGALRDTLRYQVTRDTLEFGTDRAYGATHQFGADDRHIPARPFLGIGSDDRDAILDILADHLTAAIRP